MARFVKFHYNQREVQVNADFVSHVSPRPDEDNPSQINGSVIFFTTGLAQDVSEGPEKAGLLLGSTGKE